MNELLSEFFFEVIRRIIPGLVATALFFHTMIADVIRAHHFIPIFIPIICILIFAWLFGLVVEEIVSLPAEIAWKKGAQERCNKIYEWLSSEPSTIGKSTEIKKPSEREQRRLDMLAFSEREMSRSLSAIFFVSMFLHFFKSESFSTIQWHWYYDLIGASVFLFTWLWARARARRFRLNN